MAKILNYFFVLLFLFQNLLSAQIKVISLPQNQNGIFDPVFFDKNEFRNVELLISDWQIYYESDPQNKVTLSVPAVFEGEESLVFEKKISFSSAQIQNSQLVLGFLGLNYSAEIFLNGYNIYKHPGGSYPFEIALPNDILKENSIITVKIDNRLDSENSIPSLQRFLFPNLNGGIIRDVYIKTIPPFHIRYNSFTYSFDKTLTKTNIYFKVGIGKTVFGKNHQPSQAKQFLVRINLTQNGSFTNQSKNDFLQTIPASSNDFETDCKLEFSNLQLWSPETPNYYSCEVSLILDGQVVDKTIKQIALFDVEKDKDIIALNGNSFALQGTTYYLDETSLRRLNAYQKIKDDLTFIKNTGFNAVRFAKNYPNPYAIKICQELGLFALIELPINSIPEEILSRNDFQLRAVNSIKELANVYSEYGNTLLLGAGSSFLPNSEINQNFVSRLCDAVENKGFLTYASFCGLQTKPINKLDFYGLEIYSSPVDATKERIQNAIDAIGTPSIFISELTYPNYRGNLNGYLIKNSSDAQAKYFEDMINLFRKLKISGFFINTLLDFKGSTVSLYGGFSDNDIYKFCILDYSRNVNSIPYKVLNSKLTDNSKVTIPIGVPKDDSPLSFNLLPLFIALVMAVLFNVRKKFREDCTRALLRPYNFFADVRDHRIIAGVHSIFMMLIQASAGSLLITILLFYLKGNVLFEKLLLSFGSSTLIMVMSFLAWNPQTCFLILFPFFIIHFIVISFFVKIASFFIRTKVESLNIYYAVTWAFLPWVLLLPFELILYKVLVVGSFNTLLIITFIIYFFWILQRLQKAIYVIFDVRPAKVYFYSFLIIVLMAGGIILKYQLTNSTIYYISNAIKQYRAMIF